MTNDARKRLESAYQRWIQAQGDALDILLAAPHPGTAADWSEGVRWLTRLASNALDQVVEKNDPLHPTLYVMQNEFRKYLVDNPDTRYYFAVLDELATHDLRPIYAYHKRLLQLLQWRHPKPRWVLKAPSHLSRLPLLFETYPDARVVITHRDPLRTLASIANLMTTLQYLGTDDVDYEANLRQMAFGNAYLCEHHTAERQKGVLSESQIVDLRYSDLLADPVAAVRGVYERWQIPFGGALAQRIRAHLDACPKDRHGAHDYSFADTGLDLEKERLRYASYQAHFGVPSEVV